MMLWCTSVSSADFKARRGFVSIDNVEIRVVFVASQPCLIRQHYFRQQIRNPRLADPPDVLDRRNMTIEVLVLVHMPSESGVNGMSTIHGDAASARSRNWLAGSMNAGTSHGRIDTSVSWCSRAIQLPPRSPNRPRSTMGGRNRASARQTLRGSSEPEHRTGTRPLRQVLGPKRKGRRSVMTIRFSYSRRGRAMLTMRPRHHVPSAAAIILCPCCSNASSPTWYAQQAVPIASAIRA